MKTVGKFILPDSNEFAAWLDTQINRNKGLPGYGVLCRNTVKDFNTNFLPLI